MPSYDLPQPALWDHDHTYWPLSYLGQIHLTNGLASADEREKWRGRDRNEAWDVRLRPWDNREPSEELSKRILRHNHICDSGAKSGGENVKVGSLSQANQERWPHGIQSPDYPSSQLLQLLLHVLRVCWDACELTALCSGCIICPHSAFFPEKCAGSVHSLNESFVPSLKCTLREE